MLRAESDPNQAYIDTRVSDLLQTVEAMGTHLRMHNDQAWEHLNKMTLNIFAHKEQDIAGRMEAYKKMIEDQANK